MKNKFFSFIFAFAFLVPCAFLLAACNKTEPSINNIIIVQGAQNVGQNTLDKGIYQYGDRPILDDYKIKLAYNDGSSKEVSNADDKLSVRYEYTAPSENEAVIIDNLDTLDVGYYQIVYTYESASSIEARVSFVIEKAVYQNDLITVLDSREITYGGLLPEISIQGIDENIEYEYIKYLTQDEFDAYKELTTLEDRQNYLENNNNFAVYDFLENVGTYYLYINVGAMPNYLDKYSEPAPLTVIPATPTKSENANETVPTATFSYADLYDEFTIGDIQLKDIRINDIGTNITFVDSANNAIAGSLQWDPAVANTSINYNNNGDLFNVVFVPESANFNVVDYGEIAIQISQMEISYGESNNLIESSTEYNEQEKTLYLYYNISSLFNPLDYVEFLKWNGQEWVQSDSIVADDSTGTKCIVEYQTNANEYKYKLRLRDNVNCVWKFGNGDTTNTDIEITRNINTKKLSTDIYIESATLSPAGYALLPFSTDDRLSSISVAVVNKDSSTLGYFFKGKSVEIVEVDGKSYAKFTPEGFYNSNGELDNDSTVAAGYAYIKITGTPSNENYTFDGIEYQVIIARLSAGPNLDSGEAVQLVAGKTFKECLNFLVTDRYGTYTFIINNKVINLSDTIPESIAGNFISYIFTSKSYIYYSNPSRAFDIKIQSAQA